MRCTSWHGGSIVITTHDLSIDYGRRILPIVKVLHLFVHIVFLTDFGAQSDPHLVSPIVAGHLAVGVFVRSEHLVNCAGLFR